MARLAPMASVRSDAMSVALTGEAGGVIHDPTARMTVDRLVSVAVHGDGRGRRAEMAGILIICQVSISGADCTGRRQPHDRPGR